MIDTPATLTVMAGANGSGKTTLVTGLAAGSPVLNPDDLARETGSDIAGGRRVLTAARDLISARQSFTIETTLWGNWHIGALRLARLAGFRIELHYVGVEDFALLPKRISNRVAKGGHDIPFADQKRRYPRSLANVPRTAPLCDAVLLYDNSSEAGHVLCCEIRMRPFACQPLSQPIPEWVSEMIEAISAEAD